MPVGTTIPALLFKGKVSDIQSLLFRATAAIYFGSSRVDTDGYDFAAGEAIGISHEDFQKSPDIQNSEITLYALAPVATTVKVFGFMRD